MRGGTIDKSDCTGWMSEYKWWGEAAARQTCRAWCMGLLSSRTKCIIKNTETTCQYVLLWAHEEQNWWAPVSPSHAWKNSHSCGVRYMEQVRGGSKKPWRLKCDVSKLDLVGNGKPRSRAPGAITAQQSQALSTSLCNITSMNLKVKL